MNEKPVIRVFLIEDDEDDYVLVRDMLLDIPGQTYSLEWTFHFEDALKSRSCLGSDVCLMDYRLGEQNGIECLHAMQEAGYQKPVIMLTGQGDHDIDVLAMREGAADYLDKGSLTPVILERSLRYAIERTKNLQALRASGSRLKELSRKLVDSQEKERKAIARELHDSIGANLTAIKYALEEQRIRSERGEDPSGYITLKEIIAMVKETIEEIQRIQRDLRPSVLDDMGLIAAVRWACRKAQEVYSTVEIETCIDLEEEDFPEHLKIAVYRILQEALNNALKYSHTQDLKVSLKKEDTRLELRVQDNGRGFHLEGDHPLSGEAGSGMGLSNMKERAELTGGFLEIQTKEGQGTTVRTVWTLNGH